MKKKKNHFNKKVGTKQKLSRKSEIYRKALDLFIAGGYNGTSMSMIAKTLGMSKANLYHHCSSKEDLFYKIHLEHLEKHLIPIIKESENLPDPKERIIFILKQLTLLNTTDKASRVLIPDIINLNRSHHSEIISIWRRAYDVVYNSIKELQQSGKAAQLRVSFQALLGFGMANWTAYWFDYGRKINAEELAETVVQTFLNGILYPVAKNIEFKKFLDNKNYGGCITGNKDNLRRI